MRFHYGQPQFDAYDLMLQQIPDSEFENLTRSTIPLMCYWKDTQDAISYICSRGFGKSSAIRGDVCFEYPVRSVGRAKPSFTDVMFVSELLAFGVEGKSTEPMYKSVKQWRESVKNAQPVLQRWLDLIRQHTGCGEIFADDLVYQMVHRAASVCSLGKRRCAVIYQVFEVGRPLPDYSKELHAFANAIKAHGKLGIFLHRLKGHPTEAYRELERQLATTPKISQVTAIRDAVTNGALFCFEDKGLDVISPAAKPIDEEIS